MMRSFMPWRIQVSSTKERCTVQHGFLEAFEVEIDHGSDVKCYDLRNPQAAHHHHAKRSTRCSSSPHTNWNRHRSKYCRQRRHQNWTKPVHACVMNCNVGSLTRIYTLACKVDNHDAVLLYDSPH